MQSVLEAHIKTGQFHHGYLLVGDLEAARPLAIRAAEKILETENIFKHFDYTLQTHGVFGINEALELKRLVHNRPLTGDKKVFAVSAISITREAVNAMLKIFEEPPFGTYFFLLIPSLKHISPTLRSRTVTIIIPRGSQNNGSGKTDEAQKFLGSSVGERLAKIKIMAKEKDREKMIGLINSLELYASRTKSEETLADFLDLEKFAEYAEDRGSSPAMILEHLALTIPNRLQ